MKTFEYKKALNSVLKTQNPEIIVALMEELMQRGGLEIALASRDPGELEQVLGFLKWKVSDHRY